MSISPPLLTVVIPTRDRRTMATQAVESALLPLPFACEVLLSDNASIDSTPELPGLFPGIRYIRRSETLPMADHWNLCVKEARGKYIKLLCDDDWLVPGALAREVEALEAHPDASLCASARYEIATGRDPALKAEGTQVQVVRAPQIHWQMLLKENLVGPPSGVTFRKSSFRGFPSEYSYAADWGAWILMAEQGPVILLPQAGVNFRLHDSNLTLRHVENGTDFIEVQALRRECLRKLGGAKRVAGTFLLAWIFAYRLARRIARYLVNGNPPGLARFLLRLAGRGTG